MNWETEHYNSVLEITVSFLGLHKWKPDMYIVHCTLYTVQCSIKDFHWPFICRELQVHTNY
jgi:hypothetical protein